jgi:hypothetical protein
MSPNTKESWEAAVQEAIRSLRFGSVVVTVHEGKVTQIEKREKIRPEDAKASSVTATRNFNEPTPNGRRD